MLSSCDLWCCRVRGVGSWLAVLITHSGGVVVRWRRKPDGSVTAWPIAGMYLDLDHDRVADH